MRRTTGGAPGGNVTRSRKLEGAWWGDGGFYFVASFARNSDGSVAQHDGQVWFLDPTEDTITLVLAFAYTPGDQDNDVDGPDNITVGVILAEDGEGKAAPRGCRRPRQGVLRRSQRAGWQRGVHRPQRLTRQEDPFANVQLPGRVFAITGPWRHQGRGRG